MILYLRWDYGPDKLMVKRKYRSVENACDTPNLLTSIA